MANDTFAEVSSANRTEPGSFPLDFAHLPLPQKFHNVDPNSAATQWVEAFNKVAHEFDKDKLSSLFLKDSYWRDQLCLSWDLRTLHGVENIISAVNKSGGFRIKSIALDESSKLRSPQFSALDRDGLINVVGAFLRIETTKGTGIGHIRLVLEDGNWKAFTLFTSLQELHGHPEKSGLSRPHGVKDGSRDQDRNWLQQRQEDAKLGGLTDDDNRLPVLIIGAGQAGLTVAARLKMLNVKTLIIDTAKRVGDSWRQRYHHLVLHDSVWYDHLPYMPFPPTWPVFTPKDKLASWFEAYADVLELTVWNEASLQAAKWSDEKKSWTVTVSRSQESGEAKNISFTVSQIIQATGASGEPNFPSNIPGLASFKGDRLIHSSQFQGATASSGKGKRAVIVGCCNSAHDIAQDYHNNGYSVTMIQRSTTCVIGAETMRETISGLYGEGSPPTEDADILAQSCPHQLQKTLNVATTKWQNEQDKVILDGLRNVGFQLDNGPDDSGLFLKYIQRGGGYYMDVGCSTLIAERKITLNHGSIIEVLPNGLKLDNNETLEADEIVFATGYLNMTTQTAKIFGTEIAEKVKDVWGFDEEGEIRTMWRDSGHPGLWMMGGNLALCRWYSKVLALQILRLEVGVE